jgi:RimJ/RimL family protein N-acetyltransferase
MRFSYKAIHPLDERLGGPVSLAGFYELNPLPGSNQIVISNHATVLPGFHSNGYGTDMALQRIEKASSLGYDYMLCTVRDDNAAQKRVMEKVGGWQYLDDFMSRETQSLVRIFGRVLYTGRDDDGV